MAHKFNKTFKPKGYDKNKQLAQKFQQMFIIRTWGTSPTDWSTFFNQRTFSLAVVAAPLVVSSSAHLSGWKQVREMHKLLGCCSNGYSVDARRPRHVIVLLLPVLLLSICSVSLTSSFCQLSMTADSLCMVSKMLRVQYILWHPQRFDGVFSVLQYYIVGTYGQQ